VVVTVLFLSYEHYSYTSSLHLTSFNKYYPLDFINEPDFIFKWNISLSNRNYFFIFFVGCLLARLYKISCLSKPALVTKKFIGLYLLILFFITIALLYKIYVFNSANLLNITNLYYQLILPIIIILYIFSAYSNNIPLVFSSNILIRLNKVNYLAYTSLISIAYLFFLINLNINGPSFFILNILKLTIIIFIVYYISLFIYFKIKNVNKFIIIYNSVYYFSKASLSVIFTIIFILCISGLIQNFNQGIAVYSATYGLNCGAKNGNATSIVRLTCNDKVDCHFKVLVTQLGDPAPRCAKDFRAVFACRPNLNTKFTSIIEGESGFGSDLHLECSIK
jgi:hypothetical protein